MSDRALLEEIRNALIDQRGRLQRIESRLGLIGDADAVNGAIEREREQRRAEDARADRYLERRLAREAQCSR